MSIVYNLDILKSQIDDFRNIIFTSQLSQSTTMLILPGKNIGLEIHDDADQHVIILEGNGIAILDNETYNLCPNYYICIKNGTEHDIINNTNNNLKLLVIYSKPLH